jgi:hypothetical protein
MDYCMILQDFIAEVHNEIALFKSGDLTKAQFKAKVQHFNIEYLEEIKNIRCLFFVI